MRGRAMEMCVEKEMLMNQMVAALARRFDMISPPDTDTDTQTVYNIMLCVRPTSVNRYA